eukprot:scaffold7190_cov193-Amphora_coffeaeformis.AAC.11
MNRDDKNANKDDVQKNTEESGEKVADSEITTSSAGDDHERRNSSDTTDYYDEARMTALQNVVSSVQDVRGQVGEGGAQQQQQQQGESSSSTPPPPPPQDAKISVLADGTLTARQTAPHNNTSTPSEAPSEEQNESTSSSSTNKHKERIIQDDDTSLLKRNEVMMRNNDDDDGTPPPPPLGLTPAAVARSHHTEPGAYRFSPGAGYHQEASSQSLAT